MKPVFWPDESEDDEGIDLDAPLTPEEESAVARREAVADALLAAEGAAHEAGEKSLATCLAILGMLLDIGGIAYAERELVAVRETATKALREQKLNDSPCRWLNGGDDAWNTGCGNCFRLDEGTPRENELFYCCFCGRPLEEQALEKAL